MLLTFSLALLVSTAPQGKVLLVHPLEGEGPSAAHLATVRDAVVAELKAQGYDARPFEAKAPKGKSGAVVGGGLIFIGGTFAVTLKIRDLGSNQIIASASVRCGSVEKLPEAAKEAASQLVSEAREQWGVRAKFKAPKK